MKCSAVNECVVAAWILGAEGACFGHITLKNPTKHLHLFSFLLEMHNKALTHQAHVSSSGKQFYCNRTLLIHQRPTVFSQVCLLSQQPVPPPPNPIPILTYLLPASLLEERVSDSTNRCSGTFPGTPVYCSWASGQEDLLGAKKLIPGLGNALTTSWSLYVSEVNFVT